MAYVLRRLWQAAAVLLAISGICFLLVRLAPGDPAEVILFQTTGQPPTGPDRLFGH